MRKVIIASHGEFSIGLKHSASMIIGDLAKDIQTYSLYPSETPVDFKEEIQKEIVEHPEQEFVFLCDIKGGSVHTTLSQLSIYPNVKVFSGTNLNLVLDIMLSCPNELDQTTEATLIDNAKEGITVEDHHSLSDQEDEEF